MLMSAEFLPCEAQSNRPSECVMNRSAPPRAKVLATKSDSANFSG